MFSQSRAKKPPQEMIAGGVLRAARAGAGRQEWIRIAIDELAMEPAIERVGIWLQPPSEEGDRGTVVFSGAVWERNAGNLPPEWRKISAEAPLPREVLNGASSVEHGGEQNECTHARAARGTPARPLGAHYRAPHPRRPDPCGIPQKTDAPASRKG